MESKLKKKNYIKKNFDLSGKTLYFILNMTCKVSFHNKWEKAKAYVLKILQTYSVLTGWNYISCEVYL